MKRLVVLALVFIFGSGVLMAQNRGGQRNFDPAEMAKRQTEQLTEALELDEAQEKKVYKINLDAANEMKALRDGANGNREAMRDKMIKIRDESNKEMKKVLSEEQYKKYIKLMEERRQQRGQRGGGGRSR